MVQPINVISTLSTLIAELSLCTTWHMTCYIWWEFCVLHMICTRLYPGHLSVRVGDSLRRDEEIVKISNRAFQFNCYCYYYYWVPALEWRRRRRELSLLQLLPLFMLVEQCAGWTVLFLFYSLVFNPVWSNTILNILKLKTDLMPSAYFVMLSDVAVSCRKLFQELFLL